MSKRKDREKQRTKRKGKKKKTEHRETYKEKNLQEWKRRGFPKNKVDHQKWSASSDEKKRELGEAQKRGR